jgi:hypothetical protein
MTTTMQSEQHIGSECSAIRLREYGEEGPTFGFVPVPRVRVRIAPIAFLNRAHLPRSVHRSPSVALGGWGWQQHVPAGEREDVVL